MANFVTRAELESISNLMEVLDSVKVKEVSLGNMKVYDLNGEVVGTLVWEGSWRFYLGEVAD